jgi:hypothetical protein
MGVEMANPTIIAHAVGSGVLWDPDRGTYSLWVPCSHGVSAGRILGTYRYRMMSMTTANGTDGHGMDAMTTMEGAITRGTLLGMMGVGAADATHTPWML